MAPNKPNMEPSITKGKRIYQSVAPTYFIIEISDRLENTVNFIVLYIIKIAIKLRIAKMTQLIVVVN